MPGRIIAIGDIHGYLKALDAILEALEPGAEDTLVVLGDCIDRGPDSRGVVERLMALSEQCRLITIVGNHEEMLLDVHGFRLHPDQWLYNGGQATLDSYETLSAREIPEPHVAFLKTGRRYFETDEHFFVHANYIADVPLEEQSDWILRWASLRGCEPGPHCSGKLAIVGHTPQPSGEILDLGYLKCIDTYCYGSGWLAALDVATGIAWQADAEGRLRE